MRKLFKERKLFKGGNYMRKYGTWNFDKQCSDAFLCLSYFAPTAYMYDLIWALIPPVFLKRGQKNNPMSH